MAETRRDSDISSKGLPDPQFVHNNGCSNKCCKFDRGLTTNEMLGGRPNRVRKQTLVRFTSHHVFVPHRLMRKSLHANLATCESRYMR